MWKFINEIIENFNELSTFVNRNSEVAKTLLNKSSHVVLVERVIV